MEALELDFVIPGDPSAFTGGYEYDRQVVDGLRALGWNVMVHGLDATFPVPTPSALAHARATLARIRDSARVLVDGLAFGAMPEIAAAEAHRLRPYTRTEDSTPAERRAAMTWAQRLKRVFRVDIETCADCGGAVRIIACIEDPAVIEKLLAHLDAKATAAQARPPPCRSPPRGGARSEPSGSAPLPLLPC